MSLKPTDQSDHPTKWSAKNPWKEVKSTPGAFPASPLSDPEGDFAGQRPLAAAVKERRQDYIRKRNIRVKIGTWNVASVSNTHKDLAAWFLQGLGVRGLNQDLSGLSAAGDSDSSDFEHIESVEHQENRSGGRQSTVPVGEVASVPSEDGIGLYVLGLQEIIDISSFTEAMRPYYDPNPGKKWKHAVKRGLPRGYVKIAEQQLLGLLVLVYAAPDVAPQITSVDSTSVGTGALGYVGNKGAVSVRLVLGGTTRLLFVNCHLAAGADQAALARRIWDTNQILSRTKFHPAVIDGDTNPADHEEIGQEDFAFWFGDLNYRLDDIPGEDVRRLLLLHTRNEYDVLNQSRRRIDSELGYIDAPVNQLPAVSEDDERRQSIAKPAKESSIEPQLDPENDPASLITTINSLFKHDQLQAQQRLRKVFHDGWREGNINFLPTYKYDIGSVGMFDSGEKKRSPSWCDRILYRSRQDRLNYEARIQQEANARKRDAEMKAQGIDAGAAEEEILFDYDPETDGAADEDDGDEYDEGEANQDSQSIDTQQSAKDLIVLEKYISHQRVLSSDHKPLSAVFNLTFDAVVPELRAQVQQEVARVLDKSENEARPAVTVVVDSLPGHSDKEDQHAEVPGLNMVAYGEVRYHVPATRTLTIANTGPMLATFAFVDRPVEDGLDKGAAPPWLSIRVHHELQSVPKEQDDLGTSARFSISPGEVVIVAITIDIEDPALVYALNEGIASIDEILVLRVLNGRDHFVSVKGDWCPSSFYRYLDELVRFPQGVRSKPLPPPKDSGQPRRDSDAYHSAPKELFELTEMLPRLVERAAADWTMTNGDESPPWIKNVLWPFAGHFADGDNDARSMQLAAIREALDRGASLSEHLDPQLAPLAQAELVAVTLSSFLRSLKDGLIPTLAWQVIEDKVVEMEKSKTGHDHISLQEVVTEALSGTPVHSVSLTFVTFMLTRLVSEICANTVENTHTPTRSPFPHRARSATEASDVPSELSLASNESGSTLSSFLPSLSRRKAASSSPATAAGSPVVKSPSTTPAMADGAKRFRDAYSEFWSDIIIRAERDGQAKGKDKRVLEARKKKVIEALLENPLM